MKFLFILVFGFVMGFFVTQTRMMKVVSKRDFDNGYKQGQIDALTNRIYFKLQTNTDSTSEWIEIPGYKHPSIKDSENIITHFSKFWR